MMRFVTGIAAALCLASTAIAQETATLETDEAVFMLVIDTSDRKAPYKFVYFGEFTCGAPLQRAGTKRFHSVEHGKGFRMDGQYIYPCDDVIRRRGSFLGRHWGWQLTNGEWRIDLNRDDQTMRVQFLDTSLAAGPAEFDPPLDGGSTSSAIIEPQL